MRMFLVVAIIATALFLWQRYREAAAPGAVPPSGASKTSVAAATGKPSPAAIAGTPRPVSEHNWMKRSLDRAHEVAGQVQKGHGENEQP